MQMQGHTPKNTESWCMSETWDHNVATFMEMLDH